MSFSDWVKEHNLAVEFHPEFDFLFSIESVGYFLLIDHTNKEKTFDEDFKLILNEEEESWVDEVDYYCFKFGSKFYYSATGKEISLKIFRFLGKSTVANEINFPYLGIHGRYEVMNGMHEYALWADYAKFINVDTLGICERNTLAGTMSFQNTCAKKGLNKILGATYKIQEEYGKENYFTVKCYVYSQKGWRNLLNLNAACNVFNNQFIPLLILLQKNEGIYVVIDNSYMPSEETLERLQKHCPNRVYFQFDPCEYVYESKEEVHLKRLKYIFNHDTIPSVLIPDMYYIEESEAHIKKLMNDVGRLSVHQSNNQYFKPLSILKKDFYSVFSENNQEKADLFWNEIIANAILIADTCKTYKIPTDRLYLPEFPLTDEQRAKYKTKENYLYALLDDYFIQKVINAGKDPEIYGERLSYELEIIEKGEMLDYFLILHDVMQYCKKEDIQAGFGRGSGGGSLLNYLLSITNVDPISNDLLFERFINPGRLGLEETLSTVMADGVYDTNIIRVTDEKGVEYDFSSDSNVMVERDGKRIEIPIADIAENDFLLLAL